jgi:hypothetical protein
MTRNLLNSTGDRFRRAAHRRVKSSLFSRVVLIAILIVVPTQVANSNIFGDIANGVGQVVQGAVGAVGAVGGAIGGILGAPFGGAVQGATGPAVDYAAARFTAVADHAADRMDQILQKENTALDQIAQQNIARIDQVMQTRLNQIDTIIGDRLQQVQLIADNVLDREASILDSTVNRVESISDQSLDRLQDIEIDAINRVDSALQDQVPFAASKVAQEFVIAALVVIFLVVLVGFEGVSLLKKLQHATQKHPESTPRALKTGFSTFWQSLPQEMVVVVLPMLFISLAVLGCYETYLWSSATLRVSRLEKGGSLLESAGEYKLAADLRRRVIALTNGEAARNTAFDYKADLWLADFTQAHFVDANNLMKRLASLEEDQLSTSNGDIKAASIYLRARLNNQVEDREISEYLDAFLNHKQSGRVPFLGKLVLVTKIKRELDAQGKAEDRLALAASDVERLKDLYPRYANAYVLSAKLAGLQADLALWSETPSTQKGLELRKRVQLAVDRASSLDPELMQIVRLVNLQMPPDIVKDLDENPKLPDLPQRLTTFLSASVMPLAQTVVVSNVLSQTVVDRSVLHAMRRGVGELRAQKLIASLHTIRAPDQRLTAMVTISQSLLDLDDFALAESWARSANMTLATMQAPDPTLVDRVKTIQKTVENAKLSASFAEVI